MDADFLLSALETNLAGMRAISLFLRASKDRDDILLAMKDVDMIAEDTESILREAFEPILHREELGSSRFSGSGEEPLTPKEMLEAFYTAMAIMTLDLEILMSKKAESFRTDAEYERSKRREKHIMKIIGHVARYYKSIFIADGLWTDILAKQFERYLKMAPSENS